MLPGSKVHSNPSHLVPCVVKAVQIIETLRTAHAGLRVEDFLGSTGYARSTVYRILRTLMACDYVRRDRRGAYHLNQVVLGVPEPDAWAGSDSAQAASSLTANGGQLEFERWGVRFRCDGRRAAALSRHVPGYLGGSRIEA